MAVSTAIATLDWTSIGLAIIAALSSIFAAYQKGMNTGTAKATAAPVTVTPAAVTPSAPVQVQVPIPSVQTTPTSDIYDPAKWGGQGPAFVTWEEMRKRVLFRVSESTKKFMLAGIVDQKDQQTILNAIAKAEAENLYQYTIGYDHGYFAMMAVCSPTGVNEYKYQVIIAASGMDKQ